MSLFTKIDGRTERATLSVRWSDETNGPVERRRFPRDHLCFGISGTARIACSRGLIPAAELKIGDQVANGEGGFVDVAAVLVALTAPGRDRIMIAKGALGDGFPAKDIVVGPRQRLKLSSPIAERLANQPDATVAAEDLLTLPGVEQVVGKLSEVVHIVVDAYDFIIAEGLVLEALSPGRTVLDTLPVDLAEDLCVAMPKLRYTNADAAYIPTIPALDAREAAFAISNQATFTAKADGPDWFGAADDPASTVARLFFKGGRGPTPVQTVAAKNV